MPTTNLRSILIAPDKFKGSLSAPDVSDAMGRALEKIFPDARVHKHPIADGGEGTVEMALRHGFQPVRTTVQGPMGGGVTATFAVRGGTAVIEMASASGLSLLSAKGPSVDTALRSTTFGVGQLIAAALDYGATRIVVGVGGSATTDGGAGALQALGARIRDASGREVSMGGGALIDAARLDLGGLDIETLGQAEIIVACDVEAMLTGAHGAAQMFSAQKGADSATIAVLERAMGRWAGCVYQAIGNDFSQQPGSGAAGGLAFGLAAILNARIAPGIDILLDISQFDQTVVGCDLVIIGEGSLDAQSFLGKGPIGVARRAADFGVPSVAVVGRSAVTAAEARLAGLHGVIALADYVDETTSMTRTAEVIERILAEQLPALLAERPLCTQI